MQLIVTQARKCSNNLPIAVKKRRKNASLLLTPFEWSGLGVLEGGKEGSDTTIIPISSDFPLISQMVNTGVDVKKDLEIFYTY